ncbi:hypothetical protein TURU_127891 [Turdus rufiventris]|nr:hypothetical protein TURU_127891 [Turdus rufiventris]
MASWPVSAMMGPAGAGQELSHLPQVRLHLESSVQFLSPYYKDSEVLKHIQRRAVELMKGLDYMSCEEWLKELESFSLEKRRFKGDLLALYGYLKEGCSQVGVILFFQVTNDRTRQNGLKLPQGKFRLNIMEVPHLFTERVVKHWSSLPREINPMLQRYFLSQLRLEGCYQCLTPSSLALSQTLTKSHSESACQEYSDKDSKFGILAHKSKIFLAMNICICCLINLDSPQVLMCDNVLFSKKQCFMGMKP